MNGPAPTLVPAGEEDLAFLRRCHREAMGPHVERAFGRFDEVEQRARFDRTTRARDHQLVMLGGSPVGCLWVREHEDRLELVRLYLLPEAQGRGIGTRLLHGLMDRARARGVPLELRVLKVNRAGRLYERLGFFVVSQSETHDQMRWTGVAPPAALALPGLSLARLTRADAPELQRHFSDPEVCRYLDIEPVGSLAGALAILHWAEGVAREGSGVRYAIRDATSGELLGTAGLHAIERSEGSRTDVGYDLARAHWGRGVMARVLPALLDVAFDTLDLARVQALVTPGNRRSAALLERHGFRREGVLRDFERSGGGLRDQALYALLRAERPGRGEAR